MKLCWLFILTILNNGSKSQIIQYDDLKTIDNQVFHLLTSSSSSWLKFLKSVMDFEMNKSSDSRLWNATEFADPNYKDLLGAITPIHGVSEACSKSSWKYLNNLQLNNLQSMKMLDSSGKLPNGIFSDILEGCTLMEGFLGIKCPFPEKTVWMPYGNTKALGNSESCISIEIDKDQGYSTQYCYMTMALKDESDSKPRMGGISGALNMLPNIPGIPQPQEIGQLLSVMQAKWGQCIPSSCTYQDIINNYKHLFSNLNGKVVPQNCFSKSKLRPYKMDWKSYSIITILSMIGCISLIGTLIDLASIYGIIFKNTVISQPSEKPFMIELFLCFSLYSNIKNLFGNPTTLKPQSNIISCLSGIRAISIMWIILGHTFLNIGLVAPIQNSYDSFIMMIGDPEGSIFQEVILNAFSSVDTFFFLSGLLVAYLTLKELDKNKGKLNLVYFYLHRYLRLSIPLAFIIRISVGIFPFLSYGPGWMTVKQNSDFCETNGWLNLLFINNLKNQDKMCLGVTWYLACDMQMYLVSPLIIWPLWKNRKLGLIWWSSIMIASTASIAYIVWKHDLPITNLIDPIGGSLVNPKEFNVNTEFYQRAYYRFQPYLIGILMGYILNQTHNMKFQICQVWNVIFWQLSIIIGIMVVYGVYEYRDYKVRASLFTSVIYNSFSKIAWTLALSWIVFSCSKGYGGYINDFLSWGPFKTLAKLSFMSYLIHNDIILMIISEMNYSIEMNNPYMSEFYIGIIWLTFGLAALLSLTCEIPFVNLEKLIISKLKSRWS